jgi:hypothetical protein
MTRHETLSGIQCSLDGYKNESSLSFEQRPIQRDQQRDDADLETGIAMDQHRN